MTMYARLKPYNGRTHVLRNYTIASIRFQEKQGWYEVEEAIANHLKTLRQFADDQYSAPAFDICSTLEEATAVDESERLLEERRKANLANDGRRPLRAPHNVTRNQAASFGGDLTTEDLPAQPKLRSSSSFDEQPASFDDADMAPRAKPNTIVAAPEDDEFEDGDNVSAPTPARAVVAVPPPKRRGK